MDDLIYVLIGIAWIGYSLYSASKKSAARKQATGVPTNRPSTSSPLPIPRTEGSGRTLFEEIFSEIAGEQKPVAPVPQPVLKQPQVKSYQKMQQMMESAGSPETIYNEVNSNLIHRTDKATTEKIPALPDIETKQEGLARNFNLRDAVIFSEILNRKYS